MSPTPWIILAIMALWLTCGILARVKEPQQELHLNIIEIGCSIMEWVAAWLLRLVGASRAFAQHYRVLKARDLEQI